MSRLRLWWSTLLYTLWFVPTLIILGSVLLAVGLIEVSGYVNGDVLARWPRIFGADAGSSRDMLATIAGSIITVAGVTFSITMVAVTQASAQYTPRILRNFMRDRPSQVVLGGLAGVFTYCLVVLRTIRGGDDSLFIPALAVLGGFILAGVGVGLLIYFVHHMASSLQAATIISRVAADSCEAVDRLFPSEVGEPATPGDDPAVRDALEALEWQTVAAKVTGYVQHVDAGRLLHLASRCDVVIRMEIAIGDFVIRGMPLVSVAAAHTGGQHRVEEHVHGIFTVGPYRTVEQDPEFGVRQLVDIALRALSPGINDPATALNAIDYLGAILLRAADRHGEPPLRRADGQVRVIARGPTFRSLVDAAMDEIRRYGEGKAAVLFRLFRILDILEAGTSDAVRRRHLLTHADLLIEAVDRTITPPSDRGALQVRAAEVRSRLSLVS